MEFHDLAVKHAGKIKAYDNDRIILKKGFVLRASGDVYISLDDYVPLDGKMSHSIFISVAHSRTVEQMDSFIESIS